MKFWIIVASLDHVKKGELEGFAQACHGKSGPLKRMTQGDGVVFYSPKLVFQKPDPCQRFTAIGTVSDGEVFQFKMSENFVPFRRRVTFHDCKEAPIRSIIDQLSFITNKKHWGAAFRYGFLEIQRTDFELISSEMNVSV